MSRSVALRLLCGFLLLLSGFAADGVQAEGGTWATDASVGPNLVVVSIDIACPAESFICGVVDGYSDSQTSTLGGSGALEIDPVAGTLRFSADGSTDLGFGPQPTFHTLDGSDLTFAYVPFAGVPQFANLQVFATEDALISPSAWSLLAPGDYPLVATVPYASLADVVGDLEFNVPDLFVPPQDVALSGTFRVLGDVDADDAVEYQLMDLSANFAFTQAAQIGGEPVEISVVVALSTNLSGEVEAVVSVPVFGVWGSLLLALVLVLVAVRFATPAGLPLRAE